MDDERFPIPGAEEEEDEDEEEEEEEEAEEKAAEENQTLLAPTLPPLATPSAVIRVHSEVNTFMFASALYVSCSCLPFALLLSPGTAGEWVNHRRPCWC